jgi:hypothetical protein
MLQATHTTAGTSPARPTTQPASGAPAAPPRGLSRALQTAAALVLAALAGVVTTGAGAGCSKGAFCEGGFIRQQPTDTDPGVCEGKCTQAACGDGHTCVDNKCVLLCSSHLDCTPLSQDCASVKEDDSGKDVTICQDNGKGTIGEKCPFGNECMSANACPDGKACDPSCSGSSCPCPSDQCKPLFCRTTGMGDADAFCTLQDCPGGYWCAAIRDPHAICGTMKGNSSFCGTSTDPCVDPSMDMANGTTYQEGPHCALRNECRIRKQCAPCATDLDCSGVPGQHCTTFTDGTKSCTRDCDQSRGDADCEQGFKCDNNACIPRFGSCVGKGNYCEPCRNDLDCGGKDSKLSCVSFGGSERMCIDVTASTPCTTDNDCPTGPDGRHGLCSDNNADPTYHHCFYPPQNTGSGRLSCWCSNVGSACFLGSECCSGKCFGASVANQVPGLCK